MSGIVHFFLAIAWDPGTWIAKALRALYPFLLIPLPYPHSCLGTRTSQLFSAGSLGHLSDLSSLLSITLPCPFWNSIHSISAFEPFGTQELTFLEGMGSRRCVKNISSKRGWKQRRKQWFGEAPFRTCDLWSVEMYLGKEVQNIGRRWGAEREERKTYIDRAD